MENPLRYGIIGCGMMGQEHIRNLALLDGAEVAAIFDPDEGMRGEAARLVPSARTTSSLPELLAAGDLDCLVVASPNHLHVGQVLEISATRALPLLVEKPLFTDPADRSALSILRSSYPAPIWVAMEYRYMPPIQMLIDRAAETTGGVKMLTIREHRFPFLEKVGNWNRFNRFTGGTFVEKCCHFFDLMRLIIGSDPVRVMASGDQAANHLDEVYGGERPDILDNGYVMVDFANGARAMLELCMFADGSRFQEELTAVGPDGKIEARVPGPGRFWPDDLGEPPVAEVEISPRTPKVPRRVEVPIDPSLLAAGDHNGSTFYQHQRFRDLVTGKSARPEVTLRDGWIAVETGLAAQRAAESGQAVEIDVPSLLSHPDSARGADRAIS